MMRLKPLYSYYQTAQLEKMLRETFSKMNHVDYTNEYVIYDGWWIGYRVSRYDIPTNYNRNQNILFVHPDKVTDQTLIMIHTKQAVRYLKNDLPWIHSKNQMPMKINGNYEEPF